MQEEDIQEHLGSVEVRFRPGSIEPIRFRWGRREFEVRTKNAAWTDRSVRPIRHHFSVTVHSGEVMQLGYREGDSVWILEKIMMP